MQTARAPLSFWAVRNSVPFIPWGISHPQGQGTPSSTGLKHFFFGATSLTIRLKRIFLGATFLTIRFSELKWNQRVGWGWPQPMIPAQHSTYCPLLPALRHRRLIHSSPAAKIFQRCTNTKISSWVTLSHPLLVMRWFMLFIFSSTTNRKHLRTEEKAMCC